MYFKYSAARALSEYMHFNMCVLYWYFGSCAFLKLCRVLKGLLLCSSSNTNSILSFYMAAQSLHDHIQINLHWEKLCCWTPTDHHCTWQVHPGNVQCIKDLMRLRLINGWKLTHTHKLHTWMTYFHFSRSAECTLKELVYWPFFPQLFICHWVLIQPEPQLLQRSTSKASQNIYRNSVGHMQVSLCLLRHVCLSHIIQTLFSAGSKSIWTLIY